MSPGALVLVGGLAVTATAAVALLAPRALRRADPALLVLASLVAAIGGALAPGDPTGIGGLDVALRIGVAIAFVVAASAAPPVAWIVAAALVAVPMLVEDDGAGVLAFVAVGVAVGAVAAVTTPGPDIGALVGLAVGQAALRLAWPDANGASALVAAAALLALAVPAVVALRGRARRRVVAAITVVGGACVVVIGLYGLLVLSARSDVNAGVDESNAAIDALRRGRSLEAAAHFDAARDAFARAHDRLSGWWVEPARVVPIVTQQSRALEELSGTGAELAASGARTARAADVDSVRLTDGAVPIDRLRALETPLLDALADLRRAQARLDGIATTWLVPPVADKVDELHHKLRDAAHDGRTGIEVVRILPALLGAEDAPRRYFVAFQTPAEQRANGGIIGSFAEIEFAGGRLELVTSGRANDLNRGGDPDRVLTGPADYVARYQRFAPQATWQNVTMSPDLPSVASVIENLYPQSGGEPVDGVISVDPIALAAFLELTGPVDVDGIPFPLTAKNAARFLLRDQYVDFADRSARIDALGDAIDAVIERLQTAPLPGPGRIGEVLGPMVRQGRLKLHSAHPAEQALLERLRATGALPAVRGDFLGLVTQNAIGNKMDVFLRRSVRYDVTLDEETGHARAAVTVELRNGAPAAGLPEYVIGWGGIGPAPVPTGTNRTYLSLYTPLALDPDRPVTLDGAAVPAEATTELGRTVVSTVVAIPPEEEVTVRIPLAGSVDLRRNRSGTRYRLDLWPQPTVHPDAVAVRVRAGSGDLEGTEELAGSGGAARWSGRLEEPLVLTARLAP
jgi:hypothetical protein